MSSAETVPDADTLLESAARLPSLSREPRSGQGRQSLIAGRRPQLAGREKQSTALAVLRMQLRGANPNPRVSGLDKLPGKSHYFLGNDPEKWHTNVPNYAKVQYDDVYAGIDLVYYLLHYYAFPPELWKKLRTTNVLERAFREYRRRTRPMQVFPNPESADRIYYVVTDYLNQNWEERPR